MTGMGTFFSKGDSKDNLKQREDKIYLNNVIHSTFQKYVVRVSGIKN